jgi:hypothetical protein
MNREQLAQQINARRITRGQEPLRLAHILRAVRFVLGVETIRIEHSSKSIPGGRQSLDPDLPYYTLTQLGLARAMRISEEGRFRGVLPWKNG